MNGGARRILVLVALPAIVGAGGLAAAERQLDCTPVAVTVNAQRLEVECREVAVLSDKGHDPGNEVGRFAYAMVPQAYQPLLGSQPQLLEYYLEILQTALVHGRRVRISFDSDPGRAAMFGCGPVGCREILGLTLLSERATGVDSPPGP